MPLGAAHRRCGLRGSSCGALTPMISWAQSMCRPQRRAPRPIRARRSPRLERARGALLGSSGGVRASKAAALLLRSGLHPLQLHRGLAPPPRLRRAPPRESHAAGCTATLGRGLCARASGEKRPLKRKSVCARPARDEATAASNRPKVEVGPDSVEVGTTSVKVDPS